MNEFSVSLENRRISTHEVEGSFPSSRTIHTRNPVLGTLSCSDPGDNGPVIDPGDTGTFLKPGDTGDTGPLVDPGDNGPLLDPTDAGPIC